MDTITTVEIGQCLDVEYPDDVDRAIDHFFVQLRKQYVKLSVFKRYEPIPAILTVSGECAHNGSVIEIKKVASGRKWPSIYFVKFPRLNLESQRAQERRLNRVFREPLKEKIEMDLRQLLQSSGQQQANPPTAHIIITRVCKYTHQDIELFDHEEED